ncbi:DoxX-like family protein [Bacillus sp. FJAT-42315]|uniref:DoxX-like family protein n=1 Tax=Bacillus sp. FJAT-42315 TaxID=2014077 RepID=UPI000C2321A1|nr:DoxX-like family protein [Bacillus sp. FJAT-42315]
MKKQTPIYVQTQINTSMEELWKYTQQPELHTEWDVRFTEISYLEKKEDEPQQFLYKTKIGFGLEIAGKGETIGEVQQKTGERVSSLKFWTDHPLSLIRLGRGYWKYTPVENSIQFETQYNYETNFGKLGKVMDAWLFRPLLGWATAWSFEALKLWLEKGYHPKLLLQKSLTYSFVCVLLSFIWIYQGLVPKIITVHPEEVKMLRSLASLPIDAGTAIRLVGGGEIAFGLLWLLPFQKRKWFLFHAMLIGVMTLLVWVANPASFVHPFNPLSLNVALVLISIIGYFNSSDLPQPSKTVRKRKGMK